MSGQRQDRDIPFRVMDTQSSESGSVITVDQLTRGLHYLHALGYGDCPVELLHDRDGNLHAVQASAEDTQGGVSRGRFCLTTELHASTGSTEQGKV